MCRLMAIPPMMSRKEALDILLDMEGANTDGVGSAHLQDGQFVVNKWPKSLSKVLKKHKFLEHLPHNGWTIAHMRLASHGEVKMVNTHPFIVGENEWAICHNGTWSDYKIAKLAMSKWVKFHGNTDTEVAANLINQVGIKAFSEEVSWGGVYLCLNKDGSLWTIKSSASNDLDIVNLNNGTSILSSEFPANTKHGVAYAGWYHFNSDGSFEENGKKETPTYQYGSYSSFPYNGLGRCLNSDIDDDGPVIGFRGIGNINTDKKEPEAKKEIPTTKGSGLFKSLTEDEVTERIARERETRILNQFGMGV